MKRILMLTLLVALLAFGMPLAALADQGVATEEAEETEEVVEIEKVAQTGVQMAVKAAWGLRLRNDFGLSSRVMRVLRCGQLVTVIGGLDEDVTKNGHSWAQVEVEIDGVTYAGYVALNYLTENLKPNCYLVSWKTCPSDGHPGGPGGPGHPGGPGGPGNPGGPGGPGDR